MKEDENGLRHSGRLALGGLLVAAGLAACSTDKASGPEALVDMTSGMVADASMNSTPCPACVFGPQTYTLTQGPQVKFQANPLGTYTIFLGGSRGASGSVVLNGQQLQVPSGEVHMAVTLLADNVLQAQLTAGSKVQVRVRQESNAVSVTVTPNVVTGKMIPSTQQFTAVAKDANGAVVPGQTFVWSSSNTAIATIGSGTGLATTTGPVRNGGKWAYESIGTGEGNVQIVATAVSAQRPTGQANWSVIQGGFVYTTVRAPMPDPYRALRPNAQYFRYDEARLRSLSNSCITENRNYQWLAFIAFNQHGYHQCYPAGDYFMGHLQWFFPDGWVLQPPVLNGVLLHGRYCGAGFPGAAGPYFVRAEQGNYDPIDPVDALCMDHDMGEVTHLIDHWWLPIGTCIVRYGIEAASLTENGVLIPEGSARWNAFFVAWPGLAEARTYYLNSTRVACSNVWPTYIYDDFLSARGLTAP